MFLCYYKVVHRIDEEFSCIIMCGFTVLELLMFSSIYELLKILVKLWIWGKGVFKCIKIDEIMRYEYVIICMMYFSSILGARSGKIRVSIWIPWKNSSSASGSGLRVLPPWHVGCHAFWIGNGHYRPDAQGFMILHFIQWIFLNVQECRFFVVGFVINCLASIGAEVMKIN